MRSFGCLWRNMESLSTTEKTWTKRNLNNCSITTKLSMNLLMRMIKTYCSTMIMIC